MTAAAPNERGRRVAILTPTGKDAALTATTFREAGIQSLVCPDITGVEQAVNEGVGALVIAEEAIAHHGMSVLSEALSHQEPWSDVPVLLLTRSGADSLTVAIALQSFSNVTLLERPVRPAALISAVRSALTARERQYQVREHLAEQKLVNAALEESERRLRDADRRKDEFLATLAHELRNPLAPIRNSIHILRLASGADPASEQVCDMLDRQVSHLVRLVDDLMEVSRITRGKIELRLEPVELAAVISSAVESSRPLIEDARHQLAISLPTEPLIIKGDSVRLSQIFSNLLNNAAKYMNEGGQIWLSARRDDGHVMVSVRDTGIGISAEMIPHIFKMFTQVDRSTRQAQGGLGIGLTLVRTLVEMHGGEVEVRSPGVNEGSEFVVRLPLSEETRVSTKPSSSPHVGVLPDRRVLVVDDNRDAAESLGLLLRLLGANVRVVNDGPAALTVLDSYRPSVVLLDIGMPGMDGYEVARRIRERPQHRDTMLIALTGWGQEEDRNRSNLAGFDHHLIKPADLSALETLLASLPGRDEA